ncbi:hypothetical protein ACK3ZL_20545, partial [Aeromonas caviae]
LHAETALGTGRMTSTFECSKKWGDYRIHEYRLGEAPPQVTELTGDQQIILEVLGERYRQIYS